MTKKILSNGAYLAGASLIEKIGGFIIIPILTSSLLPKDYGSLMLAVSYTGIIMLFIYNGLHSAFFRWYSMWKEDFDKKIYEKYIFYIINIIGISLIFILYLINFFYNLENILKINLYLLSATIFASLLSVGANIRGTVWIVENRAYYNLLFAFLKTLLLVIGVYFFIKKYPYPITKPIIEIMSVGMLSLYFIFSYIFKYPKLSIVSLNIIKPVLKESLRYGWGLQISQVAFWVITSSDRIMLSHLMDNKYVAYYSILMLGITAIFLIVAFNNSFSVYYNKMIADNISMEKINHYIFNYLLYGFLVILIYKLLLFYFSDFIVLLLSTKKYLIISKEMYLTSDILLFYFAYLLFSRYLHAYKIVRFIIWTAIISAIINIVLNYFFIQVYGIIGALMGSIIAYLSMAVISITFMYKKIEFQYMKKLLILFASIIVINFLIDIILYKV